MTTTVFLSDGITTATGLKYDCSSAVLTDYVHYSPGLATDYQNMRDASGLHPGLTSHSPYCAHYWLLPDLTQLEDVAQTMPAVTNGSFAGPQWRAWTFPTMYSWLATVEHVMTQSHPKARPRSQGAVRSGFQMHLHVLPQRRLYRIKSIGGSLTLAAGTIGSPVATRPR